MTEIRENKMGVMPIGKLLTNMALPIIISMLVQALYNIVDSIFVSRINEAALTAVSLAFPMQNLMIAVGTGLGVGMNALLSRSLGEKDYKRANQAAVNNLFLIAVASVLFIIVGLTCMEPFMRMQINDDAIVNYGVQYLSICCIFSVGVLSQITMERLLQSTGRAVLSMISQLVGAVINIILDPILIFGYFGLPEMGVAGAAIATIAGQIIAAGVGVTLNVKCNHEISLSLKGFRPSGKIIGRILAVGVPSIILASIGSVMVFIMNKILGAFTSTAAAVFGVYFKLQSFVFMPVFGLNNAIVPIIAFNYGAGNRRRIIHTVKLAACVAVGIMLIGVLVLQLMPETVLAWFDASADMIDIGVVALRTISLCFVFAGYNIVITALFQAMGRGVFSMFVSIVRQIVVLLPVAYLFSLSGVLSRVWLAFPIAEIAATLFTSLMLIVLNKKIISHIPEGADAGVVQEQQ